MKKIISIILMLSVALGAYIWYDTNTLHSKNILQVNIYNDRDTTPVHSYYASDTDAINDVVGVVNSMKRLDNFIPPAHDMVFKMDIHTTSGDVYVFDVMVDPESYKITLQDQTSSNAYLADFEKGKELISSEAFKDLYQSALPKIQLTYSTLSIPADVRDMSWTFKMANGETLQTNENIITQKPATTPLNADHSLSIFSEVEPQNITLRVYDDATLLQESIVEDYTITPYPFNGTLRYELTCQWDKTALNGAYGSTTYAFNGTMALDPELVFDKTELTAGDLAIIQIHNIGPDQKPVIEQTLTDAIHIFKENDTYYAILALNYWAKPGSYTLDFSVAEKDKTIYSHDYTLTVVDKTFKKQYLTVDTTVESSTRNDAAYAQYAEHFTPVRDTSINEKLWEGPFIQPVEGRISTEFGEMRYVNGALTSYRHSGIDIAAPAGTNIMAPNNGVVKLSMPLILTGETIVIDHGYGIFSVYFHMNERFVNVGDTLTKGDIIGTVGSTGFSTGPHLHWTMSYYRTNVSPWLFIERDLMNFN